MCYHSDIFRFRFFLSRCFPLTSFHLAISDVYFACVFILQRTVCEFDVLWWLGLIATCHFLPFRQISFAIVFWCHKFHSLSIPRTVFHCVLLSAVVKFCPFFLIFIHSIRFCYGYDSQQLSKYAECAWKTQRLLCSPHFIFHLIFFWICF